MLEALKQPNLTLDSAFIPAIGSLEPAAFLAHFKQRDVVYPSLPLATNAYLIRARMALENRFEFIGETYAFAERFIWKPNPSRDKEWQIAFHKCYFLIDLAQAYRLTGEIVFLHKWMALLASWLDEMGSGFITLSDAQVEAKRIESWVYSYMLLEDTAWYTEVDSSLLRRFIERIGEEALYVSEHLKAVRNHRTFQLFSVFLAGAIFPELSLSAYLIELGRDKLTDNLLAEVLEDGVHIELSTHYHQLVTETFLRFVEIAERNNIKLNPALYPRLSKALEFSLYLQWPNGDIPLINDSDNGDHRDLLEIGSQVLKEPRLLWGASLGANGTIPGETFKHFEQSGYFIFCDTWGSDADSFAARQHIFYDCARLGEGSHSHYDLFSFCYFADGHSLVVDPGRYTYSSEPDAEGNDWRHCFKSTAYHNTVAIDGKDQTRYLSRTKHGPDVEIFDKDFFLGKHSAWVSARALSQEYTPIHQRVFIYFLRQYLFVFDYLTSEDGIVHDYILRFHLSDKLRGKVCLSEGNDQAVFSSPWLQVHSDLSGAKQAQIEDAWVSTQYGVKSQAPVLVIEKQDSVPVCFSSVLVPGQTGEQGISIESLQRIDYNDSGYLCFRVRGQCSGLICTDEFLFAKHRDGVEISREDIHFSGQMLALRRAADGSVTYVTAQGARYIKVLDGSEFSYTKPENIEWMP